MCVTISIKQKNRQPLHTFSGGTIQSLFFSEEKVTVSLTGKKFVQKHIFIALLNATIGTITGTFSEGLE